MKDFNNIYNYNKFDPLKNKTILITGANGLIGGYLAEYFYFLNKEYNYNIKLILSSRSIVPDRIKHIIDNNNILYICKDLSNNTEWEKLPKIDICFYSAGYAQPAKFMKEPSKTLFLNTVGLYNTFNEIYKNNTDATCVYLSSSEIYSNSPKTSAHCEEDNINVDLNNKRNSYILGKICGESITNNFRALGRNAISARVSLCYGPGILPGDTRVLSEIVIKGLTDSHITLFDDGSASRRYIHVSDFIKMLVNVTLYGKKDCYNICGTEECTIYELACIVGNKLRKTVIKGLSKNNVSQSAPKVVWNSLERYNLEFGALAFKPLKQGVEELIDWYINLHR